MSDFHKHSSWGRTRRLKNLTGSDGTAVADLAAHPTDPASGNDVVLTIANASKSGGVLTLTTAADANIVVGDIIHVSGNKSLKNRTFSVISKPANTTIVVALDHEMKSITPQPGGTIRRRTKIGYSTENQRFLHLITAAASTVVNVWAYTYATGIWSELKLSERDIKGATDADDVRIESPIALTAATHRVVEIAGIDRLAFNITGTVYAAASTF